MIGPSDPVIGDSVYSYIRPKFAGAAIKMGTNNNVWDRNLHFGHYDNDGNFTGRVSVLSQNGNVGIGTASPGHLLTVVKSDSGVLSQYRVGSNYAGQILGDTAGIFGINGREGIDLSLGGNETSALRIDLDGNVGIGVLDPSAKLEVDYVAATQIGLTLNGSNTALNNAIKLTDASDNEILLSINAGDFGINGGNVGIGTTSPKSELHIESHVANHDTTLKIENRSGDTGGTAIEFQGYRDVDDDHWVAKIVADHENTDLHDGKLLGSKLGFYTNNGEAGFGSPRMTIDQDGNVGIGTASPGAKLEIKTETTWGTYTNEALTINNIGSSGNLNEQHGLGRIKWETNNTIGASIDAIRNVPDDGRNIDLVFSTNPGGNNTTVIERMRINHEGAIIIQNTTAPAATTNKLYANAGKLYWNGSELTSGSSSNFAAADHNHAIADITGLQTALNGKAPSSHTHAIANITGLQTALNGKASSSHAHTISNITGLQAALNAAGSSNVSAINDLSDVTITSAQSDQILYYNGSKWVNSAPSEPAFISDKKYKTEIFPISDALLKVNSIRGANFTWSDDAPSDLSGKKDVGVIAQDIQKILPEAVEEKENGDLTVKYHRIIPLLIESIKQLSEQNNALKSRLDKIEGIS